MRARKKCHWHAPGALAEFALAAPALPRCYLSLLPLPAGTACTAFGRREGKSLLMEEEAAPPPWKNEEELFAAMAAVEPNGGEMFLALRGSRPESVFDGVRALVGAGARLSPEMIERIQGILQKHRNHAHAHAHSTPRGSSTTGT